MSTLELRIEGTNRDSILIWSFIGIWIWRRLVILAGESYLEKGSISGYLILSQVGLPYPRPAWNDGGLMAPMNGAYPFPQNPNNAKPRKRPVWVIIDRVARALFPISFAIFNAGYWPWLIIGADNQSPGQQTRLRLIMWLSWAYRKFGIKML